MDILIVDLLLSSPLVAGVDGAIALDLAREHNPAWDTSVRLVRGV